MADIFVAYKSEDRECVAPLVEALTQEGYSVFWDQVIPASSAWREFIAQNIKDARVVILCWSDATEHATKARWVLEEADEAERLHKPIMPVRLRPCRPPLGYRNVQAARLFDAEGNESSAELARFLREISGLLGRAGALATPNSLAPELTEEMALAYLRALWRSPKNQRIRRRQFLFTTVTLFVVLGPLVLVISPLFLDTVGLARAILRILPPAYQDAFVQSPNVFMFFLSMALAAIIVSIFWFLAGVGRWLAEMSLRSETNVGR